MDFDRFYLQSFPQITPIMEGKGDDRRIEYYIPNDSKRQTNIGDHRIGRVGGSMILLCMDCHRQVNPLLGDMNNQADSTAFELGALLEMDCNKTTV